MSDQPTRSMKESLDSVPGVTVRQGQGARDGNLSIRGAGPINSAMEEEGTMNRLLNRLRLNRTCTGWWGRGLVLAVWLLVGAAGAVWAMGGARPPAAGMPASEFSLTDLDGKSHGLEHYRGKIILLNFWATWCKPCMTEMPAMQTVYDQLRDKGFVVLAAQLIGR